MKRPDGSTTNAQRGAPGLFKKAGPRAPCIEIGEALGAVGSATLKRANEPETSPKARGKVSQLNDQPKTSPIE